MVDEVFCFLMGRIENSFRELLDTDLALYPADKWKDKGWDFIDSLDPKREWGGFSYMDMPDPVKGQEVGCCRGDAYMRSHACSSKAVPQGMSGRAEGQRVCRRVDKEARLWQQQDVTRQEHHADCIFFITFPSLLPQHTIPCLFGRSITT
jgi:hypothetical protein